MENKLLVTNITAWVNASILYKSLAGKLCKKTNQMLCFYNGEWMPENEAKKLIFDGNELQNANLHSKENPCKKMAWMQL